MQWSVILLYPNGDNPGKHGLCVGSAKLAIGD